MATVQDITAALQAALDEDQELLDTNRGTTWMRIRRQLALVLRDFVGDDYFVKVRASREDRENDRIQVRALFAGNDVSLTLQRT